MVPDNQKKDSTETREIFIFGNFLGFFPEQGNPYPGLKWEEDDNGSSAQISAAIECKFKI